ncbi:MAG: hypothetical protein IPQ07_29590 [Myxococcales bacterium]|nr:hypothetical protein [Myxococcales bacterium]
MTAVLVADEPGHGRVRRAIEGARTAVIPGLGIGAVVGLLAGIPIVMCGGAGAIVAITVGAVRSLVRGQG